MIAVVNCFSIRNGICTSEIDVTIRIEYRNIENDSNVHRVDVSLLRIGTLEFRLQRIVHHYYIVCRCEAERLFASAGDKGIACAKRIEIPLSLCLHLPCVFSAFPFHPRRANRSNRRALSVCRSVYRIRMYKERKNGELVGGSMRNGRDPLSLRRASRSSHGESR